MALGRRRDHSPARPQRTYQEDGKATLIISRVVAPASKLPTVAWRADITPGPDLG